MLKLESDNIKRILIGITPIIIYTLLYLMIHQTQNVLRRFQFPILPTLYIVAVLSIGCIFIHPKTRIHAIVFMCLFGLVLITEYNQTSAMLDMQVEDNHKIVVGKALSVFDNFTLATTDAGIVPYYSQWKTVDLLGLNDRHIAQNGFDPTYIDTIDIHLFMTHTLWFDWNETNNHANFKQLYTMIEYFTEQRNFTVICVIPYSMTDNVMNLYAIAPAFEGRDEIRNVLCSLDIPYIYNLQNGHN